MVYFLKITEVDTSGIKPLKEKYFPEFFFHDGLEHGIISLLTGTIVIPNEKDDEQSEHAEDLVLQLREQFEKVEEVKEVEKNFIITLDNEQYVIPSYIVWLHKKVCLLLQIREYQDYSITQFDSFESALYYFSLHSFSALKKELEEEQNKLLKEFS